MTRVIAGSSPPMEIETRSFQLQINLSQSIVRPAIRHAQVQEEEPLPLKFAACIVTRVPVRES
jgi:hypothetical protein